MLRLYHVKFCSVIQESVDYRISYWLIERMSQLEREDIMKNSKTFISKKIKPLVIEAAKDFAGIKNRITSVYWATLSFIILSIVSLNVVYADLFDQAKKFISDIYADVFLLASSIAGLTILIALIIRMVSRSDRAVELATAWAKRILITYAIIMCLGALFKYIEDVTKDQNLTLKN